MSGLLNTRKWTVPAGIWAVCTALSGPAYAEEITADDLMTKLSPKERGAYLAGVVEGLAYANYQAANQNAEGMDCIKNWFYNTEATPSKVLSALENFPEYAPSAVLYAMIQKECG